MEIHAHVPKVGQTVAHWLLEGVFIVISVGLGFGVAQCRESRQNHEIAARVLRGFQSEVEHNVATLEPQIGLHRRWMNALRQKLDGRAGASETARDVFMATWPDLQPENVKAPIVALGRVAWDTALSTGALRLIDYDVAARLSEIYRLQDSRQAIVDKLPYHQVAFFDPASRTPSVYQLAFDMDAIAYTEEFLLASYRRHLPAIRAAAGDQR